MTIQLSPVDQSTLKKQVQQIANVFAPLANVNVTASEAVAPGGCRVVTEFGVIDQQIRDADCTNQRGTFVGRVVDPP